MGLVQKSFGDIITFSRSSNATRVGPTGVLEYAPHNLMLQSQTLDNASWTASSVTVTANATSAPDGTVTADVVTENSLFAAHRVFQSVTTTAIPYTVSCYLKAGSRNWGYIRIRDSGPIDRLAFFNLATGVLGTTETGLASTIQSVGNGWYRCTATLSSPLAGSNPIVIGLSSADGTEAYTGNGTGNIYIWGAQLAVGPYALDYVPTTSAAVYGPRFDYDGSGVTIVEPVSTNLVTYSEDFGNAAWTKSGVAITANATTSPDGTVNATLIASDSAAAPLAHQAYQIGKSLSASTAYTASIYAKANTLSWLAINLYDTVGLNVYAYFNLSTGVVGTVQGGGSATITALANGWFRCTFTRTLSNTSSSGGLSIEITNADNSIPGTLGPSLAVGTGIYLWGAQLEVGSTATAYMVSGASNGFRAVPVVSGSATPKGLLVEEQRQNLLTYSAQFDNAAWSKNNSSITANAIAAPDGTITADKLVENNLDNTHRIVQSPTVTAVAHTVSIYAKAGERAWLNLRLDPGTDQYAFFDLANGVLGTVNAAYTATIQSVGNGWYRCSITRSSVSAGTTNFVAGTSSADNTASYTGDGTSGLYIWGAQLEAGSFATSYIPTLASAVTRTADVASVNTLSPWYNQSAGTFYAEIDTAAPTVANKYVIEVGDGSGTNRTILYISNVALTNGFIASGGVVQTTINNSNVIPANTTVKQALAYELNNVGLVTNGGTVATDTSATIPTVTALRLGASLTAADEQLNGHLRRVAYYPRRLTNAELQALTA